MDWPLIITIATPFFALIAHLLLERRPNVVAYFSNIASFRLAGEPPHFIHSHSVRLRNNGRRAAEQIKLRHQYFGEEVQFNVQPEMEHLVERTEHGGGTITITKLLPKEEAEVSYMYPVTLRFDQISGRITHSEGYVKHINTIPARLYPKWFYVWIGTLILIGLMLLVYWASNIIVWMWETRAAWLPVLTGA